MFITINGSRMVQNGTNLIYNVLQLKNSYGKDKERKHLEVNNILKHWPFSCSFISMELRGWTCAGVDVKLGLKCPTTAANFYT